MDQYECYWDENIDKWADLYLNISHGHENLNASPLFSKIYKSTVGRIEARLMKERYVRTIRFLDTFVDRKTNFVDVGCGTGIFTVEALKRGAKVNAIDVSEKALDITKSNVKKYCAVSVDVQYTKADLQKESLKSSFDVVLAMGVTPYIKNIEMFLDNILPHTKYFYCQYTSPRRPSNIVRSLLPFLNVRNLIFHSPATIDKIYKKHNIYCLQRSGFATGFIDLVVTSKNHTDLL